MEKLPPWWPDWRGSDIVIVASGPSASECDLSIVRDRAKVIAVNSGILLCPWADLLFAADPQWWIAVGGAPDFGGIKVCTTATHAFAPAWNVNALRCRKGIDLLLLEPKGVIGWGGNSGFQALNLACQLAPRRIMLVGFDHSIAHGLHFHDAHSRAMGNPTPDKIGRWLRAMAHAAKVIKVAGIVVVNCGAASKIDGFPKQSLAEAMESA